MRSQKFLSWPMGLGLLLACASLFLFFKQGTVPLIGERSDSHLLSQNTNNYLGPNEPGSGKQSSIRIQVLIYNDPNPSGVEIEEVYFDQTQIPLKPRDIYGFRGQGSFQKPAGTYLLKWIVRKNRNEWPRTETHEQKVQINPKDLWIQITITGNEAEIS